MATPLVATKLYAPRVRSSLIPRPRLTNRLDETARTGVTLVSAPAGFGKTTAVTAWLASASVEERNVAWVSLEEGDGQPARFWTYVVTALQGAVPGVGASLLPALQSGQPPTRELITTVLNEITEHDLDAYLVLDDYHLVDGPEIADSMTYLIDHLPPRLHVVVSTRADPALPLARLRARGQLLEVRAHDLRFTDDEISAYLGEVHGLSVTSSDVAALAGRTEGWAAALQLAALSMQGRDDVAGFVSGFAGDDRYIVDYLVDEVLSRQPEHVRIFLLSTSVLDRLTGDLCDAVTGSTGGRQMLESLDRANLFVVPLDDQRRWYRYHQLFADVLRAHADEEPTVDRQERHARASRWFAEAGEPDSAIRHALAAGDADRAADIAERAIPTLQRARQEVAIRGWLDVLPDHVVRTRPVLAIGLVGALLSCNELAPAADRLREVERWLPAIRARLAMPGGTVDDADAVTDPECMVVGSEAELARVPAAVDLFRAAVALAEGDLATTITRARLATDGAGPDDHLLRGSAAGLSGLASWAGGDLEGAHGHYTTSIDELRRADHLSDVLGCTIALADIRICQGRLSDALVAYEGALRLADSGLLRGVADMHVGISEIALERGDLSAAQEQLTAALDLGDALGLPQFPYRWRATSAALAEAHGDLAAALDLLTAAEGVYLGDFSPNVQPLHARRARILLALGEVEAASQWAVEHALAAGQEPTFLREFEYATLAEVLLAEHRRTGATATLHAGQDLLDRLLANAVEGGRNASIVELLVLQSLAKAAAGDGAGSLAALEDAVAHAEPEGFVRAFARHRAALVAPLGGLAERGSRSPFLLRLVARFSDTEDAAAQSPSSPPLQSPAPAPSRGGPLVEPLTARELEVLRLLATELDGPAIARHLVVSLHTVRTHSKHVYAKLGVNSRRAAVRRAGELGLLAVGPTS